MANAGSREPHEGSLTIVGTGIQAAGQFTTQALNVIKKADKLLYLVLENVGDHYVSQLNPNAESLKSLYVADGNRFETYTAMAERILAEVRKGLNVCAAFYGHPCVFVLPSRLAVKLAREEGFRAQIFPGISAEDCLFADLGVDPAVTGCQSFEATNLLVFRRHIEPASTLIIWQVGVIGDTTYRPTGYGSEGLSVLTEYLSEFYPLSHEIIIYEASIYGLHPPRIDSITLAQLPTSTVNPISTLYIPPAKESVVSDDMLKRLGLDKAQIHVIGSDLAHALI
jgi:precorrin-2 methylase